MTAVSRVVAPRRGATTFARSTRRGTSMLVGGKANALGRAMRAGLRVPTGFVLTDGRARRAPSRAAPARRLLSQRDRADELLSRVAETLLRVRGPVVVRSSAVGEDARPVVRRAARFDPPRDDAHGSRAGGARVLGVDLVGACARSIASARRCRRMGWASWCNTRSTRAPRACCSPMRRWHDARRVHRRACRRAGRRRDRSVPFVDRSRHGRRQTARRRREFVRARALGDRRAHDGGADARTRVRGPQDVEWVLGDDGKIWIVQSRPITARVVASQPAHDATRAETRRVVERERQRELSRGRSRRCCTRSRRRDTRNYFRNLARAFGVAPSRIRAMEPAFRQIIGVHGARMYYNLTSIHSVLRLAPFGNALAASFDTFVGADGTSVETSDARSTRYAAAGG